MLRKRIGRGPLACTLFFIGTLFPALGFANLYPMRFSFVADHFQYLATIGPLTLIAAGLSRWSMRRGWALPTAALLVTALMTLTFARTLEFRSEKTLYADSIGKNPNGWMTQTNYGGILGSEGDLDGAEAHLKRAISLHPVNGVAADRLGLIAEARRRDDRAIYWFHTAIALEPKLGGAYYDLAGLLDRQGHISDALSEYRLAIEVQHNSAPAHLDYGVLLASLGKYAEAAVQFKEAIRIDPASSLARRDLIAALERSGQLNEAADQIHILLLKHPDDATTYNNLGLVETALHNTSAAMAAFSRALAIDPGFSEAREHLDALIGQPATRPLIP